MGKGYHHAPSRTPARAPGSAGKTVIACGLIVRQDRPTLVMVDRKPFVEQWHERLTTHLRLSAGQVGQLHGGRKRATSTVDVAMMQRLASREDLGGLAAQHGYVVVDERHHVLAVTFERCVGRIAVRRSLGLTATPYRRDGLRGLIAMRRGRTPRLASWSLWSTEPRSTLQTWATLASRKCSAPSSRMGTGMKRSARIRRCRRQRTQLLGAHPMDSTPRTDRPIRRSCAAPDRRQGHRGIPRPCRPRGPRAGPDPGEAHARPRQPRLRHEASPVSRVDHGSRRSGRCPSAEAERCAFPSVVGRHTPA